MFGGRLATIHSTGRNNSEAAVQYSTVSATIASFESGEVNKIDEKNIIPIW